MANDTVLNASATLDVSKYLANAAKAISATKQLTDAIGALEEKTKIAPKIDLSDSIAQLKMLRAEIAAIKEIKANVGDLSRLKKEAKETENAVKKAGDETQKLKTKTKDGVDGALRELKRLTAGYLTVSAAIDVLNSVRVSTGQLEKSTNAIAAITGLSAGEIQKLSAEVDGLSQKYGVLATDINNAVSAVGSQLPQLLGTPDKLLAVTENVILLQKAAIATNDEITALDAARITGQALNQFGADADQAPRFVNAFAAGTKEGASGILQTSAALVNAGGALAAANVSFEEANALIQALAASGEVGERAGTSLTQFALKLQEVGRIAGRDVNPQVVGINQALKNLAAADLDSKKITAIFGDEGARAARILNEQLQLNVNSFDELEQRITGTTEAANQYATTTGSIISAESALSVSVNRLSTAIGDRLAPAYKAAISEIANYANATADLLKTDAAGQAIENIGIAATKSASALSPLFFVTKALGLAAKDAEKPAQELTPGVSKETEAAEELLKKEAAAQDARLASAKLIEGQIAQAKEISNEKAKAYISDLLTKERETAKTRIELAKETSKNLVSELEKLAQKNTELRSKDKAEQLTAAQELREAQRESTKELFGEKTGGQFVAGDIKREITDTLAEAKKLAALGKTDEVTALTGRARELSRRDELGLSASDKVRRLKEIQEIEQQSRTAEIGVVGADVATKSKQFAESQNQILEQENNVKTLQQRIDELSGKEVVIDLKIEADAAALTLNNLRDKLAEINSEISAATAKTGGSLPGFKTGGIVPFTGIAALHGTPGAPEAVLNARATAAIGADTINAWNSGDFQNSLPRMNVVNNYPGAEGGLQPVNITIGGKTYTDTGLFAQAKEAQRLKRILSGG